MRPENSSRARGGGDVPALSRYMLQRQKRQGFAEIAALVTHSRAFRTLRNNVTIATWGGASAVRPFACAAAPHGAA